MKTKEIKDLSEDQIETLIEDLEKEIFELKNELAVSKKLEQPHLIKEKRVSKARAITILQEKKKNKLASEA